MTIKTPTYGSILACHCSKSVCLHFLQRRRSKKKFTMTSKAHRYNQTKWAMRSIQYTKIYILKSTTITASVYRTLAKMNPRIVELGQ